MLACLIPAVVYFSLVSTATYYFDPKYRLAYSGSINSRSFFLQSVYKLILFPWFIAEEEFWLTRIIAGLAVCAVAILQLKTLQIGSSQENHKVKTQIKGSSNNIPL